MVKKIAVRIARMFNFIQQKSPTSISGEMNASFYQFSGVQTLLNEVKASGGCHGFFRGNLSSELDKNPGANSTGRI
jgi:hypothetical protein